MKSIFIWVFGLFMGMEPYIVFASGNDSIKVEHLLDKASRLPVDSCRILFFARQLLEIPYVAHTLDTDSEEKLVVHLDKMDCTTFVETVLALAMADKEGNGDFGSFKQALRQVRYRGGRLEGYSSRLHYFSDWIKDNERKGIVRECTRESVFSQSQVLNLNFMSVHPDSYRQLRNNRELMTQIINMEREWKGVSVSYIPKNKLNASPKELGIKNGDILAITTNVEGLDVVHTGIACWVQGKLHLIHASSFMKKVILDPQSLYDYSKNKKAHTGVRVVSWLGR